MEAPPSSSALDSPTLQRGPVTRDALYEMVWKEPMLRIASRFGVSSSYLARVCVELRVPRPPRGYWAKVEFGKTAGTKPPLPVIRAGDRDQWLPGVYLGTEVRTEARLRKERLQADASTRLSPDDAESEDTSRPSAASQHPLLFAARTLFLKTRDSRDGLLRPFKRLLPDIRSTEKALDEALALANALYNAFGKKKYEVRLAPPQAHMKFERVDLKGALVKEERGRYDYHEHYKHWWPDRPTIVYIDDVPIGLTLFEMLESVECVHYKDDYIPKRDITPELARKMLNAYTWTVTREIPTGRFCLCVYAPSPAISWAKLWKESKRGQLEGMLPSIVREARAVIPELQLAIRAAEEKAAAERRKWEEEKRQRAVEEDIQRRAKAREDARVELLETMTAWGEAVRVQSYFTEVERMARELDEQQCDAVLQRLAAARELIGPVSPLAALLRWKSPEERVPPRT